MPIDFTNFDLGQLRGVLPLQSLILMNKIVVLSSKEADSLMDIWEGYTDTFGRKTVPTKVEANIVRSLIGKGLIESESAAAGVVRFTSKGKSFVRKEILGREVSSFDKNKKQKVASRMPAPTGNGWLAKAMRNG